MDWRYAYLRAAGIKPNPQGLALLAQWQPWEGGHTKNDATNNYLNTSEQMPGSRAINSTGIQAYGSLAQGARAFAMTLHGNPHYAPLVAYLSGQHVDPTPGLETWVSGSPTGNSGYAAKILGSSVPSAPAQVASGATQSDFVPLAQPGVGEEVRAQALAGLGYIARGKSPTDVFADTVKSLPQQSLQGLAASVPKVEIPTQAQGGDALDTQAAHLVQKYLGVKYTWGGTSASTGFDCSGLVQTVWKQLGVSVPRTSQEQYKAGVSVKGDLRPGDALFFVGSDGTADAPGHEGLYIGNGKFIEAPHTGSVVRVSTLAGRTDYVGARRFA